MARIIYSALVSSIRGSIAGTTFQNNRYGYSSRNKPISANQRTNFQISQRSAFLQAVRAWSNLSTSELTAWNNSVASNPKPSKNNPAVNLDTYNYFVLKNAILAGAGMSLQVSPSNTTYNVGTLTLVLNVTSGIFNVSTSVSGQTDNWHLHLYLSPPLPNSVNNARLRTRYIQSFVYETNFFPGVGSYNSRFGIDAATGDRVYARCVITSDSTVQIYSFDIGILIIT